MFAITHGVISVNIIDELKRHHNIDIKDRSFIWGNIKPDISKTYITDSHYRDESIDSVTEKIIQLSNVNPMDINDKANFKEFLTRLGIVAHYVSDYFCLPHNSRWRFFEGYNKEHIAYETRLETMSKRINDMSKRTLKEISIFDEDEIKLLILEANEMYKEKQSFINDIVFAVNVCVHIIKTIILKIFSTKKIII